MHQLSNLDLANQLDSYASSKYTYIRELRELDVDGVNVVVVIAHSHPLSSVPKKSGVIRVTDYHQSLAIKSDGKVGTKGEELHVCLLTLTIPTKYLLQELFALSIV